MDKSTIQTITIILAILGSVWFSHERDTALRADLTAQIADNREAITLLRIEMAELKAVVYSRAIPLPIQTAQAPAPDLSQPAN